MLLEAGASVDKAMHGNVTALITARHIFRDLVWKRYAPTRLLEESVSPLGSEGGHDKVVRALTEYGADVDWQADKELTNGCTALVRP